MKFCFKIFNYRISSNNQPLSHPYRLLAVDTPIAIIFEDKAKVESDPATLISDDSSSDAEDIDKEPNFEHFKC